MVAVDVVHGAQEREALDPGVAVEASSPVSDLDARQCHTALGGPSMVTARV
jgi:hypothetical protein